jgi:hypothetical protein
MKISKLLIVVLVAAFSLGLSVAPNTQAVRAGVITAQASNGATVTKIRVSGRFAEGTLLDVGLEGIVTPSHDQITNTSGLDFSYAYPDSTNSDQSIFIQGSGAIPNSALTFTSTSAHLAYTATGSSSFILIRCVLNNVTGTFHCDPGPPIQFDLRWVKNGLGSLVENTTWRETVGPVTTKYQGGFTSVTADFTGTWDGHTATVGGINPGGRLLDTHGTTITREITVEPNP